LIALWLIAFLAGIGLIVWGAEAFAEHLGSAAVALGVSSFALALLLAGAEPEELATVVTAAVKGAPGIALGDVIGANVTGCLVALGLGAVLAPLPCRGAVLAYGALALPLGALAAWIGWSGAVGRVGGTVLVGLYIAYVGLIWRLERRPPRLGEVAEIDEARDKAARGAALHTWRDLALVAAGVAAMILGASLLVDAVHHFAGGEGSQLRWGLSAVGFATGFELVVLAWSTARRGKGEAAVAAVMGSFAYNVTMTLGAGALARPLAILDAGALRLPWLMMVGALALALGLALPRRELRRGAGILLLAAYLAFLALVFRAS
jgi:cation:H+ antiporter